MVGSQGPLNDIHEDFRTIPALLAVPLLMTAVALLTRPLLPVDETRYVGVAWEMWARGDFLVPHINGAPYSHKPPLLFWLIHLGWSVFGVNDWWPRLVSPLISMFNLGFTVVVARKLWPDAIGTPSLGALVLVGTLGWSAYLTLTAFDMLVVCFTLIGVWSLTGASESNSRRDWLIYSLCVGMGMLAKGPVGGLYVVLVALLAPCWVHTQGSWKSWYKSLALYTFAGIVVILLWAIPAAISGGSVYREAMFWHQTAGRMVSSFAHQQPWWWYFAMLPVVLFPWSVWPPMWRACARVPANWRSDRGLRLCAVWFLAPLVVMSLISGKQAHYLLPILPALALALARLVSLEPSAAAVFRLRLPACIVLAVGISSLTAQSWLGVDALPDWAGGAERWLGAALCALGLLGVVVKFRSLRHAAAALAACTVAIFLSVHFIIVPRAAPVWDVRPLAQTLSQIQRQGQPIAHVWRYYSQYQFAGRLHHPIEVIYWKQGVAWATENPDGFVLAHYKIRCENGMRAEPVAMTIFRGRVIALWNARTVQSDAKLVRDACL